MRSISLSALTCIIFIICSASSHAAERRCGWFENPTPANATLTDRNGMWEIATQGGYQAEGDWPDFSANRWVRTGNGNYGYGCACINFSPNPLIHGL